MRDLPSDTGFHGRWAMLLNILLLGLGALMYLIAGVWYMVDAVPDLTRAQLLTMFLFVPLVVWSFGSLFTGMSAFLLINEDQIPNRKILFYWSLVQLGIGGLLVILIGVVGMTIGNPA